MKRDSMIIYRSFFEAIKELPKENQAEVWNAVYELGLNGERVELKGISKTIFTLISPQLDANYKKFLNGIKPKQKQVESKTEAKQKQKISKTEANVNVNVNDNDNIDILKTSLQDCEKLFIEKTLNNWTEHYAKKEALKFYNFYSAKGWVIGKSKMKSLSHAVGGWISRQDKPELVNAPVDRNKTEKMIFY